MAPDGTPLQMRYVFVAENFVTVLNILFGRALEEAGELPPSDPMSRFAKNFMDERNAA